MATLDVPPQPSCVLAHLNKAGFGKKLPPITKPSNFRHKDYKPGGQQRIPFRAPAVRECNIGVLMDDSGSMKGDSWWLVRMLLVVFVDAIMQNDKDGLDWWWLNEKTTQPNDSVSGIAGTGYSNVQNPDFIAKLFDNRHPTMKDTTPTGARLQQILRFYINTYKSRKAVGLPTEPFVLIFLTDGEANDKPEVKKALVWAAQELDKLKAPKAQLGIQIFQVGTNEATAEWLEGLDDRISVQYECRDIVDTKSYNHIIKAGGFTVETLMAIILGPIVERLDGLKSALENTA